MSDHCLNFSLAIVDDDQQLMTLYQRFFSYRGIAVSFVAGDGATALDRFRNANPRPSIVIIDYRMPAMNGIELTKAILEVAPGTKIILVSADDCIRYEAMKAGASEFLTKPVGLNDVLSSINALAGR